MLHLNWASKTGVTDPRLEKTKLGLHDGHTGGKSRTRPQVFNYSSIPGAPSWSGLQPIAGSVNSTPGHVPHLPPSCHDRPLAVGKGCRGLWQTGYKLSIKLHMNKTYTEHKGWIPASEIKAAFDGLRGPGGPLSTYGRVSGDELLWLLALPGLSLRWFSTRSNFILRGHLAMFRGILGCHNWREEGTLASSG